MEINKIYLGDAYELIKNIPDNSIDLIYTDIPYLNTQKKSGGFSDRLFNEQIAKLGDGINYEILNEFKRVLKVINIYIWCSKDQIKPIINYFNLPFVILGWGKTNAIPRFNNNYLSNLEYCLYIYDAGRFNNFAYDRASRYFISAVNMEDKKDFEHPTIKPLQFVKNHLQNSCPEGGVILDPFLGSGTTAVAARELNMNYIGFEIDENYYKIACDRLNGIKADGTTNLFETDYEQLQIEFEETKK